MDKPTKLYNNEIEYKRWYNLNNKITKETRLLFIRTVRLKTNKKINDYGINWNKIIDNPGTGNFF